MEQSEANRQLNEVAVVFARVFSSVDGIEVLKYLRMIHSDRPLIGAKSTPEDIIAKAASHDVIEHIETMKRIGTEGKNNGKPKRAGLH